MGEYNRGNFMQDPPTIYAQNLFEESATQKMPLSTVRRLSDGREYVYCKAGTSNIAAGHLTQGPVGDLANIANLAVTANANIGDKTVSITMGNSALANTANAFAGGMLHVNTGAGNGCAYRIDSHAAIAANANGNITLSDKLRANLAAATSKITLSKAPENGVVIHDSPPTNKLVGVATFPITANYYFWAQRKGLCAVENEAGSGAALIAGRMAYASPSVSGTITGQVSTANGIDLQTTAQYPVGRVIANNANDHWALIDLDL